MTWFSVQMDAVIVAGLVAFNVSLIVALAISIFTARKGRHLEFAAEGVARAMLMDREWPYRTFRVLKYHLSGFTDDELRQLLIRAGGIRLTAGGQEVWGLLTRNRDYLGVDEIKDVPTAQMAFDASAQPLNPPQQQSEPQADPDHSPDSSSAFERVRAEMIKLSTLECVGPVARQK
jgi:hypothetical protein